MSTTTAQPSSDFEPDTELVVEAPDRTHAELYVCDVERMTVYHVQDGDYHDQHPPANTALELLGIVAKLEQSGNITAYAARMFKGFVTGHPKFQSTTMNLSNAKK